MQKQDKSTGSIKKMQPTVRKKCAKANKYVDVLASYFLYNHAISNNKF